MTVRIFIQVTSYALAVSCLLSLPSRSLGIGGPSPHDQERLGPVRRAGLQKDQTQIQVMIAALQENPAPSPVLLRTLLHSLAQLGALDAVPAVDSVIQNSTDKNIVNYAKAARARLLAESNINGEAEVDAKASLDQFYQQMQEQPADINSSVATYRQGLKTHPTNPDTIPDVPKELYAMRELADMAYESQSSSFAAQSGIASVDFHLDGKSALKVRLAPLSSADRIAWLVQDLSHKTSLSSDEFAEIQLAGDLGPEAGKAAATKLQEMDQHRDQYTYTDFAALFGVVEMSGDVEPSLWKHFEGDADPKVAQYAQQRGAGEFVDGY